MYSFIVLVAIVALGNDIGIDTKEYIELYNSTPRFAFVDSSQHTKELGYFYLSSIFREYKLEFNDLLSIITMIGLFATYFALSKRMNLRWSFLAMYLLVTGYIFVGMFGQIRQHLVMSIFLLSTVLLAERKYLKYYSLSTLSIMFHNISALYFVAPFFTKIKLTRKLAIAFLLVSIVCGITNVVLHAMYQVFDILSIDFLKVIVNKVLAYFRRGNSSLINFGLLEKLLLFSIVVYFLKDLLKLNKFNQVLISIYFLHIYIFFLLVNDLHLAGRISKSMKIVEIMVLPQVLDVINNKFIKVLYFVFLIFLGFLHYYKELLSWFELFVPYRISV